MTASITVTDNGFVTVTVAVTVTLTFTPSALPQPDHDPQVGIESCLPKSAANRSRIEFNAVTDQFILHFVKARTVHLTLTIIAFAFAYPLETAVEALF